MSNFWYWVLCAYPSLLRHNGGSSIVKDSAEASVKVAETNFSRFGRSLYMTIGTFVLHISVV